MKAMLLATMLMLISGCEATMSTRNIKGIATMHLDCSGITSSWDKCYEKAEEVCGVEGYRVLGKTTDLKDDNPDYPFGVNPAGFSSRGLIVKCGKSPVAPLQQ